MKVDGVCKSNNGIAVVFLVVFLVLMSSSSSAAASRGLLLFPNKPSSAIVDLAGEKSIQNIHHYGTAADSSTDFSHLMGGEECDDEKDEECEKRRMVAEAHLDYIYTQNHKQP